MTSTYVLNGRDLVGLLVVLAIMFGPLVLLLCCGQTSKPSLPQCPHCGAEYRGTPTLCYACGHRFIRPVSHAAPATVIHGVRQTDANKSRPATEAHTPPAANAA